MAASIGEEVRGGRPAYKHMNTSSIRSLSVLSVAAILAFVLPSRLTAGEKNPAESAPAAAQATTTAKVQEPAAKPPVPAAAPAAAAKPATPPPQAPAAAPAAKPPPTAAVDAREEKDFFATSPIRLEEVEIIESHATALTQAPTESSLDVYQPQSVVDLPFIANHLAPTADYSTIANVAPSVANVVTNGPGLNDAKRASLRGFNDGQYNVTYDGIPFADTNDFTHHTSSYFPAKMIGRVTVDRGPGTASSIGEATFGGTIALLSKDPRTDLALIPTLSYGSNSTFLGHIEANSGALKQAHDASLIASYQYMRTDGYLTNAVMNRDTTYIKYLQPVGKGTTITFLSNYNKIKFNNPVPVTQAQIDSLGRNFGLSDNPGDPLYYGYNYRKNSTDFEYVGVDTQPADSLHVNAKGYTYYYGNRSYDTASLGTKAWNRGDNVGRYKLSAYRAFGETLNIAWDNPYGILKLGGWHEYQRSKRIQYGLDYTKGTLDYNPTANPRTAYFYDMVNYLYTTQLFAEYDWRLSKSLTINGGVRNAQFKRKLDADINQTTKTPLYYSKSVSETMGSGSINYSLTNDWTVYGQVAQGYLAPNLNQFYVPDPTLNRADPQKTLTYQAGTVYKTDRVNADISVYEIDYKNYPRTTNDYATGQTIVVMAKGAWFSGVEAEATFALGGGFSLYGNGSINHAEYKKSKLDVDMAAQSTAAFGLLYDQNGFFGSLITKYVGRSKIYYSATAFNPDDPATVSATGVSGGYSLTDFAIGYGIKFPKSFIKSVKIKLEINNILDRKVQVMDSYNSTGSVLFDVLPTRNYFITVSGEF